jgi:hypothetical protein
MVLDRENGGEKNADTEKNRKRGFKKKASKKANQRKLNNILEKRMRNFFGFLILWC